MAAAAILNFRKVTFWTLDDTCIARIYKHTKFGANRSRIVYFPRWRPPPSWICYSSIINHLFSCLVHIMRFFTVQTVQCTITAELGRASAVVKVTLQVNGRSKFSGSRPVKTTAGIKMKCGTIDYVGGATPHAKVGSSRITGGRLPIWVTCTSSAFCQLLFLT